MARGATWRDAELKCGGRRWSEVLERCWAEDEAGEGDWAGVSLANFTACPHNLAPNRQTRMLADLALVNCYNTTGQVTTLII